MENEETTNYAELQNRLYKVISLNGWGLDPTTRIEKITEEVVEFYEALYDQKADFSYLTPATVGEAADVVITIMGLLAEHKIDLLAEVHEKITKLESGTREPRGWRKRIHIDKRNVENGVRLTITALRV